MSEQDPAEQPPASEDFTPRPYTRCPDPRGPLGDAVVEAAVRGESVSGTARALSLSPGHVRKIARARGVVLHARRGGGRRPKPGRTFAPTPEALALASQAPDIGTAARLLGCSTIRAKRALVAAGLPVPVRVWRPKMLTPERAVQALRRRKTLKGAAASLHCSVPTVRAALEAAVQDGDPEASSLASLILNVGSGPASGDFRERFALFLERSRMTRNALAKRIALGAGRNSTDSWAHWLERRASQVKRPGKAKLLGMLTAARAVKPQETLEWLMGERALDPWGGGASVEPAPPRVVERDPVKVRREGACRERLRGFLERAGFNRYALARHLHESSGLSTTNALAVRLFYMESGMRLLKREQFVRMLACAGWPDPEAVVAWLYGERDAPLGDAQVRPQGTG